MLSTKRLACLLPQVCLLVMSSQAQSYWGTKARWGIPPAISHLPVSLFHYQYGAGFVEVVDTVRRDGLEIDVDALACVPTVGLVAWEVTPTGSQMVLLDSTTAVATNFGAFLSGTQIRGACFDREQDILALDHLNDALLRIRSSDGTVATSVPLNINGDPFDLIAANDLDFVAGTCYLHAGYTLYSLDTISGAIEPVFTDTVLDTGDDLQGCSAVPALSGMAELPAPGLGAYVGMDGNCEDDLLLYDVISASSRIELLHDVIPIYNGGAEDLAKAVPPISTGHWIHDVVAGDLMADYQPGNGLLLSTSKGQLNGRVEVVDLYGRVVLTALGNGGARQSVALTLAQGCYLVRIQGTNLTPAKFVVR
jgi:hypothetical protein